jgi:hypothetical protein
MCFFLTNKARGVKAGWIEKFYLAEGIWEEVPGEGSVLFCPQNPD